MSAEKVEEQEAISTAETLKRLARISNQFSSDELRVIPAQKWGVHYPEGKAKRNQQLKALLRGEIPREEAAKSLRPDAILFDAFEVQKGRSFNVEGRLRDVTTQLKNFDYEALLDIAVECQNRGVELGGVLDFYESLVQSRIRQKVLDSLGYTGRRQIYTAMRDEIKSKIKTRSGSIGRVLDQLKKEWMAEEVRRKRPSRRKLSKDEKALVEIFKSDFDDYVVSKDPQSYNRLIGFMGKKIEDLEKEINQKNLSQNDPEAEAKLRDEVEPFMPPNDQEEKDKKTNFTTPPEEDDTYQVPPLRDKGINFPKMRVPEFFDKPVIFEIEASGTAKRVKIGKYTDAVKSHYNHETLDWSTRKQLHLYQEAIPGEDRQTITGKLDHKLFALPIPKNHQIDFNSLKYSGTAPEIFQDQNGSFYIRGNSNSEFSVDFLPSNQSQNKAPIPSDLELLSSNPLNTETESLLGQLSGDNSQKALQIQQHIWKNHVYPGNGQDADLIAATQSKLKHTSNPGNYIQNLDNSEALECYSAATLGVAICRRAGIPARLCTGHQISSANKGRAQITHETGHGWAQIWTGAEWVEIDFTPVRTQTAPDPNNEEKSDNTPTQKATQEISGDPGELDNQENSQESGNEEDSSSGGDQSDEEGEANNESSKQDAEGTQSGNQGSSTDDFDDVKDVDEVSDEELKEAEEAHQSQQNKLDKNEQRAQEIKNQINQQDGDEQLEETLESIRNDEDLLEDTKKELEKKVKQKADNLKNGLKEELEKMAEEGFINEDQLEKALEELSELSPGGIEQFQKSLLRQNQVYQEYESIRLEVLPMVEQWFEHFMNELPKTEEFLNEDSLVTGGDLDIDAINDYANHAFQTVYNPRFLKESAEPRFLASLLLDVSGSMDRRMREARKLLIFYSELFTRITHEYGFIRFSIHLFANSVSVIKDFDHEYDSPKRYLHDDRSESTIKVRLMNQAIAGGGTNMLPAVSTVGKALNQEKEDYPDHLSAFYLVGDGGDTQGNSANIKALLEASPNKGGLGEHIRSATLIGDKASRHELASMFGEENTQVAGNIDEVIALNMEQVIEDIKIYLEDLPKD